MSTDVMKEVPRLYMRVDEDYGKAIDIVNRKESLSDAAKRFHKLGKRCCDIFKMFEQELCDAPSMDIIVCKGLLHFVRAMFITSYVLMDIEWFDYPERSSVKKQIQTLPARAVHKIVKKTFQRRDYIFQWSAEDYEKHGLPSINTDASSGGNGTPKYKEDIHNVAIAVKQFGVKLKNIAINAQGLFTPMDLKKMVLMKESDFNLAQARADLLMAKDIMIDYYAAILEFNAVNDKKVKDGTNLEDLEDPIICLFPLMEKFELEPREIKDMWAMIETDKKGVQWINVGDSYDDIVEATGLLLRLSVAPTADK